MLARHDLICTPPPGLERSLGFSHMALAYTLVEMGSVLQHGSPVDRDRGLRHTARAVSVLQTRAKVIPRSPHAPRLSVAAAPTGSVRAGYDNLVFNLI